MTRYTRAMGRLTVRGATLLMVAAAVPLGVVVSASSAPAAEDASGLAATPPLGWNDWNSFGCDIDEQDIKDTADLFVSTGLVEAGYEYINIDDCWAASDRTDEGELVANAETFPSGIAALADYVHARGLKLGIYSSAGDTTCQRVQPGSLGHELTDARTFARWGVDYLKYDNCGDHGDYEDSQDGYIARFQEMADALETVEEETGHEILYSVCEWGNYEPWTWADDMSQLWRTTFDISDNFASMLGIFEDNVELADYASPGNWNDPDMLQVGNGGMTGREYRSHFSLWSMMAAPLLIGTDLREHVAEDGTLDDTFSILKNKAIIAIDQDSLGKQAELVKEDGGGYVLAKPLANGDVAVALFNSTDQPRTIATTARKAGLSGRSFKVKDLWSKRSVGSMGNIRSYVPAHATRVFRVKARSGRAAKVTPMTTLGVKTPSSVDAKDTMDVTVSEYNDGKQTLHRVNLGLTAPDGWKVSKRGIGATTVKPGRFTSTVFRVKAPAASEALDTVALKATGSFRFDRKRHSRPGHRTVRAHHKGIGSVKLVSPVADFSTANTTNEDAIVGQLGDELVVEGAGSNLGPASNSPFGSTPAGDEYVAAYVPSAAADGSSVTTTLTAQGGSERASKAGLIVRDDMDASGTPVGVALYRTGTGSIGMTWSTSGGTTYTTSASTDRTTTVGVPVKLRLARDGLVYTGSYSTDGGSTWTTLGTATVGSAADSQDAGVFSSSGSTSSSRSEFGGLSVD